MKLPGKALRTLLLLPDDFVGSITFHRNASAIYTVEIRSQERYRSTDEDLIALDASDLRCREARGAKGPKGL